MTIPKNSKIPTILGIELGLPKSIISQAAPIIVRGKMKIIIARETERKIMIIKSEFTDHQ